MKCVLLAGGKGTRLQELTQEIPKPLLQVDGLPILLHIMDTYAAQGVSEFLILVGYKGHLIKEYFINFVKNISDVKINLESGETEILSKNISRPYKISIIDTGLETPTGGRLNKAKEFLSGEKNFYLTYGDGLSNVNLRELAELHMSSNRIATVTGVRPPGRFGAIAHEGNEVTSFEEKPRGDGYLINGGFFILNEKIFDFLNDNSVFELDPLQNLAREGELSVHLHEGFWQCIDTLRDLRELNTIAASGIYPWLEI
jgi:glucose-1-phosphate cytidylyltransferase